jgi:MFS family permease
VIHFLVKGKLIPQALISALSFGMLQLDHLLCRWGRKRSITISCIMYIIAGPVAAFAPHYLVFCFARLALGMSGSGTYNCGFTLCKWHIRFHNCNFVQVLVT